jgi:hypothetical protein
VNPDTTRLAVEAEQFELPALRQFQLALQGEAVEDRLRQAGGERIERRFRTEQQTQRGAGVAAVCGQRDARKECGARRFDAGVGGGKLRLGGADIGTLVKQLRWQAGAHARNPERIEAPAAHAHRCRRAPDQQRQRGDVLPKDFVELRNLRALACHQRFLLATSSAEAVPASCRCGSGQTRLAASTFWFAIRSRSCEASTRK